jgi:hypothetical protein
VDPEEDGVTFFKDLDSCSYFGKWEELLTAVGWLEDGNDFAKGTVREDFFTALVRLCAEPWQPVAVAGRQPCPFCRFTKGPGQLLYGGMTVALGAANVFVPGVDRVFVAPTMIVHYIDAHEYAPPPEFQDAVMRCPGMKSFAYLKAMKARGITVSR